MAFWYNRNGHFVANTAGLAFHCSTCPCPGCQHCSPQAQPEIQLVISGITNSSCTRCSTLNGTFILRNAGSAEFSYCIWEYNPSGGTTCSDFTRLRCQFDNDGDIEVNWIGTGTEIEWFNVTGLTTFPPSTATPFNCSTINNFAIPYSHTFSTQCDGSGSSCILTAL